MKKLFFIAFLAFFSNLKAQNQAAVSPPPTIATS